MHRSSTGMSLPGWPSVTIDSSLCGQSGPVVSWPAVEHPSASGPRSSNRRGAGVSEWGALRR